MRELKEEVESAERTMSIAEIVQCEEPGIWGTVLETIGVAKVYRPVTYCRYPNNLKPLKAF